jgi:hypothetical protein
MGMNKGSKWGKYFLFCLDPEEGRITHKQRRCIYSAWTLKLPSIKAGVEVKK